MTPILYDKDEISFITNGLCRLRDCISCEVTEERNGIYECDFTYPIDGANFDYIIPGRIVGVTHDDTGDTQPFDIVGYSRPIDGVVTFHCVHISYRLKGYVFRGMNWSNMNLLMTALSTTYAKPFTIKADFTATGYIPAACDNIPRTVRQVLGGCEGSILDTFGGEYEWDKFKVTLHKSRGQVRDFSIRYGVNMVDFTDETDYEDTFNAIVPYWNSNGDIVSTGIPPTPHGITYTGRDIAVPLDVTDKFESKPTSAQLENFATSYLNSQKPYLPKQNIKVEFIRLQDTPEYEQFSGLLQCSLCDSIKVVFPDYSTDAYFKIVRTVWDVLEGRFIEMELGDLATTLSEALGITANSTGSGSNISLESGRIAGTTVASGTYVDVSVQFTNAFTSAPNVVCCLESSSTSSDLGMISAAILAGSVTTSGFSVRIFNGSSASRAPGVRWLATNSGPTIGVTITQDANTNVLTMR